MKKSHVFLTPATKNKAAEVIELEYSDEPQMYAPVVPYFDSAELALPDASVEQLQKQLDELTASLPKLKAAARAKAEHRIRVLEREITAARSMEEAERRNTERQRERQRQQVGADSPFARQSAAQAKKTLACNASPRCVAGTGRYQCARCRATAALA